MCKKLSALFLLALAIFLLGVVGDQTRAQDKAMTEKIETLIQVFGHPQARGENLDETNRAIKELVSIGKPAIPQILQAMLNKNLDIALSSAHALEGIGAPAVPLVRAAWPKWTEAEKWKFMRFRGKFDYAGALDFALASLSSRDGAVASQAVAYLCEHKEARARDPLLKILASGPPALRWDVIDGLADLGNKDVVKPLVALLKPDSWAAKGVGLQPRFKGKAPTWWPDGRKYVIDTLAKLKARAAAPALLAVLQEKGAGKGYLGDYIIPLLGDWGCTASIPALQRILAQDRECWRENVARVLLQLKDRSGVPLLLQALTSGDDRERGFACRAFAQYGDKSDIPFLGQALLDDDAHVQSLACQGLERITGIVIRAPGQTKHSLADVPLWQAWFEKNKAKYQSRK